MTIKITFSDMEIQNVRAGIQLKRARDAEKDWIKESQADALLADAALTENSGECTLDALMAIRHFNGYYLLDVDKRTTAEQRAPGKLPRYHASQQLMKRASYMIGREQNLQKIR